MIALLFRHRILYVLFVLLLAMSACGSSEQFTPTAAPGGQFTPTSAPAPGITLTAEPAFSGYYRAGAWLPVQVTVQNDAADISVRLLVGNERENSAFTALLDLPRGARKSVTVYAHLPAFARQTTVRLLAGETLLARERIMLEPQPGRTHLIGVVGEQSVPPPLPRELANSTRPVAVVFDAADLPELPQGLSSFDTLVLLAVDTARLTTAQRDALVAWVALGGQLVLSGGHDIETTLAGLPEQLRPVRSTGVVTVAANELLLAANDERITISSFAPPEQPARLRSNGALVVEMAQPLLVEQPYGRGLVVASALPLDSNTLIRQEGATLFWADILRLNQVLPPNFVPNDANLDTFIEGNIAPALTSLPALEFPSLSLIGALLVAYILLVGPATYLILRRFDRLALGWVVVPALTALFAAGGYLLSYTQRGGDLVFNQIALIEPLGDGATGLARVRSFIGVFSPEQNSYQITLSSNSGSSYGALARPISLQGPWDPTARAGTGEYVQQPVEEGAALAQIDQLQVAQWSMHALLVDEIRPYQNVEAVLTLSEGSLQAQVFNGGDQPLTDVVMVHGDRLARFGDLAPGERRSATFVGRDNLAAGPGFGNAVPISYLVYGEEIDRASGPRGMPLEPEIQQRVRLLDTLYSYSPVIRRAGPLLIGWLPAPPLQAGAPGVHADHQNLTMISMVPQIVADGMVSLGQNWLDRRYDAGPNQLCIGAQGLGTLSVSNPTRISLRLPDSLSGLAVETLNLVLSADGAWPTEANLRLYDWTTGTWSPLEGRGLNVEVTTPERFVSRSGEILVELVSSEAAQMNSGCLYVDAELRGQLPTS